jgi:hypothetical protein
VAFIKIGVVGDGIVIVLGEIDFFWVVFFVVFFFDSIVIDRIFVVVSEIVLTF